MADVRPGMTAVHDHVVAPQDTAEALGSGSLPVLGTPRLLAWCEAATCAALVGALGEEETSLGTRVGLEHVAPAPVGAAIEVMASVVQVDGRLVRFTVAARMDGTLVASGEVTRVVVDSARFLDRAAGKAT